MSTASTFTPLDWAALWAVAAVAMWILQRTWNLHIRPRLAGALGWPDLSDNTCIPPSAWLGAFVVMVVLGCFAFAGRAAGF